MVCFILNNENVEADVPDGFILLDFIRNIKKLKGTKSACREGDCGSCTVLAGTLKGKQVHYKAITSCITPMGNIRGKHVVTIEGLNGDEISPIQQALIDSYAIQCGYCTPGIVLSLTGYLLSGQNFSFESAKDAIAGNICRCTGYKSIERALDSILKTLKNKIFTNRIDDLVKSEYLPGYFKDIHHRLSKIQSKPEIQKFKQIVGGGTDLYVQKPDELKDRELLLVSEIQELNRISVSENTIKIGAACKISDLVENEILNKRIPGFNGFMRLIASDLIRNMATIAGNLVNASPIGDLSIIFLALESSLIIKDFNGNIRRLKAEDFFKSYKKIEMSDNEYIAEIECQLTDAGSFFNFEKVSKRKYLDIASVNSAISIELNNEVIESVRLSIGGVSPVPLLLRETNHAMTGKTLTSELLQTAAKILDKEISPISDVRGSAEYKRLLARQLFFAHFLKLFPERFELKELAGIN